MLQFKFISSIEKAAEVVIKNTASALEFQLFPRGVTLAK